MQTPAFRPRLGVGRVADNVLEKKRRTGRKEDASIATPAPASAGRPGFSAPIFRDSPGEEARNES